MAMAVTEEEPDARAGEGVDVALDGATLEVAGALDSLLGCAVEGVAAAYVDARPELVSRFRR